MKTVVCSVSRLVYKITSCLEENTCYYINFKKNNEKISVFFCNTQYAIKTHFRTQYESFRLKCSCLSYFQLGSFIIS